jgi:hypothetical protein
MHSVTVRLRAAELSAKLTAIGEWLSANQYEPIRYKYDHADEDVLVTVDFPAEVAAKAFAARFEGGFLPFTGTRSGDKLAPKPAT